jgi:hypothetical protein
VAPAYGPLVAPLFEYGRNEGQSVTGGVVYRGQRLGPPYQGRYFFADFASARVWSLGWSVDPVSGDPQVIDRLEHSSDLRAALPIGNISAIDIDAAGEMYLVDWSRGQVLLVAPVEGDDDGDLLPDEWERKFGLDPASPGGLRGAAGEPDGDGRTNIEEYAAGVNAVARRLE